MKTSYSSMIAAALFTMTSTAGAGGFDAGAKRFSLQIGAGSAFGQSYTVFGVGFDYAVIDGLFLGLDASVWSGADPRIYKFSPQASYVFNRGGELKPYGGVFYRNTAIDGQADLDSAGFRAGAYVSQGSGYHLSVGYVYERYLSCEESVYNDCTDSYPELSLSFSL
jgi:hypothetical protein